MRRVPDIERLTPLRIHWTDAVVDTESWADEDSVDTKVHGVVSAGLYLDSDSKGLAITLSYDSTYKTINQAVTIPIAAIDKIEVLVPMEKAESHE